MACLIQIVICQMCAVLAVVDPLAWFRLVPVYGTGHPIRNRVRKQPGRDLDRNNNSGAVTLQLAACGPCRV